MTLLFRLKSRRPHGNHNKGVKINEMKSESLFGRAGNAEKIFAPTFQDQPFVENNFVSFHFVMQNFFLIPFNGLESESQKPS